MLHQPLKGYRAGLDPVLLAAAVPARAGDRVLELGCGAGAALLCLATRVCGLDLTGVELQPDYAELCRRNAEANGVLARIVASDLRELPEDVRQRQYDHVIANPPYFEPEKRVSSADPGREIGRGGPAPLREWIHVAARRLAPRGVLSVIQRAERLPEMLTALDGRLGSAEVLPLTARPGRSANLVVLRARKDGRAPFILHAPLILHEGDKHLSDAEDYCEIVQKVLRDGAALDWPR